MTAASVPWNAGWTAEEIFEVRPCRWVEGRLALWQPHKRGEGRPIFAKPHMVRQRQSIAQLRCTVCGHFTERGDRWWFGQGSVLEGQWATTEAPVHGACAHHALAVCPHLKALGRRPTKMPSGFTVQASIVGGEAFEREFGIAVGGRTILGSLKLVWPMVGGKLAAGIPA